MKRPKFMHKYTGRAVNEELYRTIVETAHEGIWVIDEKAKTTFANKVMGQMLGYTAKEMMGVPLFSFMDKLHRKRAMDYLKRRRKGISEQHEFVFRHKDGSDLHALLSSNPLFDRKRNYIGAMALVTPIAERLKQEERLRASERKFKELIEVTTDWMWEVGRDGKYTYTSPKVKEMLGYDPSFVLGKTPFYFMPEEEAKRIAKIFREKASKKKPFYGLENTGRHKNGHLVILETNAIPLFDEKWRLRGYRGIDRDITRRKKAEEALAASEANYRTIFDYATDAIIIRDINTYRIVDVNKKACEMFCYPKGEMIRLGLEEMYGSDDPAHLKKCKLHYEEAARGEPQLFECMAKDKAGRRFWVEVNVRQAMIGGKSRLVAILRDATERKRIAEMKDNFMNTISHELRTPLAAVKESVGMVLDGLTSDIGGQNRELLAIAKRNVDRLSRMVNNVLDFQKIDSDMMKFDIKEADLNGAVRECYETMLPLAKEKGLGLILKMEENLPKIEFDWDRIVQVIANIISNAVKFTNKGSITVATGIKGRAVHVSVKDTGTGIKKDDMSRLFRKFEQIREGGTWNEGGTGLGLAISKEIIERHGGKIWAESTFGQGSIFHIALPIK